MNHGKVPTTCATGKCSKLLTNYFLNYSWVFLQFGFVNKDPEMSLVKLRRFYGDLWQRSGYKYKRTSLANARAGLNRHLISPLITESRIWYDTAFQCANYVFYGLIRTPKQHGLDSTVDKSAISQADYQKFYSCGILDTTNPVTLHNKVFAEINLHFCHREGRIVESWKR